MKEINLLLIKSIIIIFIFYKYYYFIFKEIKKKFFPKTSIILPIYNREKYLKRSIGSIQKQTLKDIEIMAINDYSTDNSLSVLKKLAKKDIRIKIINNDRNHGPLYTRAMGILNSTGEYIMALDPDDKLQGKKSLELLYNKAKLTQSDYVKFLIKRIPLNNSEIRKYKLLNKNQLKKEEFLFTNKYMKRKLVLKAYKVYKKKIFANNWRYHDDNIWHILIQKNSKSIAILNKYIYIYKRNNESAMLHLNTINEISNRIYRFEILEEIINNKNLSQYIWLYKKIFDFVDYKIFKNNEIKKKLIRVSYFILKLYFQNKYNNNIFNLVNYCINKISNNKIIIFFYSYKNNFEKNLRIIYLFNFLNEYINKKIIFINVNNKEKFNDILNFIYPNDILVGLDNIFLRGNFYKSIKYYSKRNNIIFLLNEKIRPKINFKTIKHFKIFSFNNKSYSIIKKFTKTKNTIFYFIPDFIKYLSF